MRRDFVATSRTFDRITDNCDSFSNETFVVSKVQMDGLNYRLIKSILGTKKKQLNVFFETSRIQNIYRHKGIPLFSSCL